METVKPKRFSEGQEVTPSTNASWTIVPGNDPKGFPPRFGEIYTVEKYLGEQHNNQWFIRLKELPDACVEEAFDATMPIEEVMEGIRHHSLHEDWYHSWMRWTRNMIERGLGYVD